MTRWFRLYDDTLNDPKILKLSDKSYRIWIGILCVASKNNGALPPFDDIALMLRMKPEKLQPELEKLISAGLIDHDDDGLRPHNWEGRQYKSDVSTDRVKRFRNGKRNVSETPPDTEQSRDRTETENSVVQIEDLNAKIPRQKKVSSDDPSFIEFYSAYPRRQSKQDAIKAYSAVLKTGVTHETIMRGLEAAKRVDRRFRDPQFTPLPASWLRAGGFEDEAGSTPQQDWKRAVFS